MSKGRLEALQQIADIMLDQRLAELRMANAQREDTRRKITALEHTGEMVDCHLQAQAKAAMLYQAWADGRRRELNQILARQSVAVMTAEDASRLAFGRHTALKSLKARS